MDSHFSESGSSSKEVFSNSSSSEITPVRDSLLHTKKDDLDNFLVPDSPTRKCRASLTKENFRLRRGQLRSRIISSIRDNVVQSVTLRDDLDMHDIADSESSLNSVSEAAESNHNQAAISPPSLSSSSPSVSATDFGADADPEDSSHAVRSTPRSPSPCAARRRPLRTAAPITFHDAYQFVEPGSAVAREARALAEARRHGLREDGVDFSVPSYVLSAKGNREELEGTVSKRQRRHAIRNPQTATHYRVLDSDGEEYRPSLGSTAFGPDDTFSLPSENLPSDEWSGPQCEHRLNIRNAVCKDIFEFICRCGSREAEFEHSCLASYDRRTAQVFKLATPPLGIRVRFDTERRIFKLIKRNRPVMPAQFHALTKDEVRREVVRAVDQVFSSSRESRNVNDYKGRAIYISSGSSSDESAHVESSENEQDSHSNSHESDSDEVQLVSASGNDNPVEISLHPPSRVEDDLIVKDDATDKQIVDEICEIVQNTVRPADKVEKWYEEILCGAVQFAGECHGVLGEKRYTFPVFDGNTVIPILKVVAQGLGVDIQRAGSFACPVITLIKKSGCSIFLNDKDVRQIVNGAISDWRQIRDEVIDVDAESLRDDIELVVCKKRACDQWRSQSDSQEAVGQKVRKQKLQ